MLIQHGYSQHVDRLDERSAHAMRTHATFNPFILKVNMPMLASAIGCYWCLVLPTAFCHERYRKHKQKQHQKVFSDLYRAMEPRQGSSICKRACEMHA